jgi:hypothetical protein
MDFLNGIKNWPFLNEPLYRWALFFVAMCIIAMVWRDVLSFMA